MKIFRAIYNSIATAVLTSFWGILAILLAPFSSSGKLSLLCARMWGKTLLYALGVKVVVKGIEHIDLNESYLFMSNHKSALDIISLYKAIPLPLHMLSKKKYFYIPIMGLAMWAAGYPFIDRGNRKKAVASLKKRKNILIYPEGTRSRDGALQPFKKGSFYTVEEVKIPIVPIVIMGTNKLMPAKAWTTRTGTVYVYFGRPIPTDDCTGAEGRQKTSDKVHQAMEHLINIHTETVEN